MRRLAYVLGADFRKWEMDSSSVLRGALRPALLRVSHPRMRTMGVEETSLWSTVSKCGTPHGVEWKDKGTGKVDRLDIEPWRCNGYKWCPACARLRSMDNAARMRGHLRELLSKDVGRERLLLRLDLTQQDIMRHRGGSADDALDRLKESLKLWRTPSSAKREPRKDKAGRKSGRGVPWAQYQYTQMVAGSYAGKEITINHKRDSYHAHAHVVVLLKVPPASWSGTFESWRSHCAKRLIQAWRYCSPTHKTKQPALEELDDGAFTMANCYAQPCTLSNVYQVVKYATKVVEVGQLPERAVDKLREGEDVFTLSEVDRIAELFETVKRAHLQGRGHGAFRGWRKTLDKLAERGGEVADTGDVKEETDAGPDKLGDADAKPELVRVVGPSLEYIATRAKHMQKFGVTNPKDYYFSDYKGTWMADRDALQWLGRFISESQSAAIGPPSGRRSWQLGAVGDSS